MVRSFSDLNYIFFLNYKFPEIELSSNYHAPTCQNIFALLMQKIEMHMEDITNLCPDSIIASLKIYTTHSIFYFCCELLMVCMNLLNL